MITQAELLRALGGIKNGSGVLCAGPNHKDRKDTSLSVKPSAHAPEGFVVYSFAGDDFAECRDYVRQKLGLPEWKPTPRSERPAQPIFAAREYIYNDANDKPHHRVEQMSDGGFRHSHWDDVDGWVSGEPSLLVPYNLSDVLTDETTWIVHREYHADLLRDGFGLVATTYPSGLDTDEIPASFLYHLSGRDVRVLDSGSERGSEFARKISALLGAPLYSLPEGFRTLTQYSQDTEASADGFVLVDFKHESETTETPRARFRIRPLDPIDPTKIPPREWLLDNHLIRKFISVTAAPGGMGKSSMVLVEALAMAANRPLFEGMELPERRPLKVYVWMGEDPLEESQRRLAAAMIHYGVSYEEIKDTLFIDSGRDMPIKLARMVRGEIAVDEEFFVEMTQALRDGGFDVMVLDPFVQLHSVSENDNGAIDTVAKRLARVADEANCAIEIVAHVRKQGQGQKDQVTMDDMRGAGSLKDAVRSGRVLNFMPEEVAEAAGVAKEDRLRHFSVKGGKANLSPNTGDALWRKMVGVPLGNGNDKREQDYVGVCTKYDLPECAQEMTQIGDIEDAILMKLRHSDEFRHWRSAQPPKEWVGYPVIEYVRGDTQDKSMRGRVQKIILSLINSDRIHIRDGQDARANTVAFLAYGPKPVADPYDDYTPPPHDDQPF